jgi:hypothetical protein
MIQMRFKVNCEMYVSGALAEFVEDDTLRLKGLDLPEKEYVFTYRNLVRESTVGLPE